jgi:hypothetical protein
VPRPESNPAYLAACVEAFRLALREAEVLATAQDTGPQIAALLQHASELLDIIADGVESHDDGPALGHDVELLQTMLTSARALIPTPRPAH